MWSHNSNPLGGCMADEWNIEIDSRDAHEAASPAQSPWEVGIDATIPGTQERAAQEAHDAKARQAAYDYMATKQGGRQLFTPDQSWGRAHYRSPQRPRGTAQTGRARPRERLRYDVR